MENNNIQITEEEAKFCLLYVNGVPPYIGNARECYKMVYHEADNAIAMAKAKELLASENIQGRIKQLREHTIYTAAELRPRLTETLTKVMEECAVAEYTDKDGTQLSPAALRAVSVNAAGKLMDMYGIKEDIAHEVRLSGKDGKSSGITFNVIVPEQVKTKGEIEFGEDD